MDKVFKEEFAKFHLDSGNEDDNFTFPIDLSDYEWFARYFFEKGIEAQKKEAVEEYADKKGRPKIYRGEMMVLKAVADKDGVCLQELAKKLEPFVID